MPFHKDTHCNSCSHSALYDKSQGIGKKNITISSHQELDTVPSLNRMKIEGDSRGFNTNGC